MSEVQDIFKASWEDYAKLHKVSAEQSKAASAIINCRTSALGAHIDTCDECGYERISYNSCRNRHCPKCQTLSKEQWLDKQKQTLLDVPYFHVVFTVPDTLNGLFLRKSGEMYGLLFKVASETLIELCSNKKHLGATPGITAILHTWGQNLGFHPHLHCVVTGGGLSSISLWRKSRKKFFIPVKVLSRKFRGKLLALLKKMEPEMFFKPLYAKDWVVYCKPPFGNATKVIDYLGRYTHRVAISNNRILSLSGDGVSFQWRDYGDGNKSKVMTVSCFEFIRRFLMHVLPSGFRKIRHYGILASRDKTARIALCKRLTDTQFAFQAETTRDRLQRIFGEDFDICPCCHKGHLSRASPAA
jgi:predicted Zn-ribbon and HTH transcriptional regulator